MQFIIRERYRFRYRSRNNILFFGNGNVNVHVHEINKGIQRIKEKTWNGKRFQYKWVSTQ
jgi:hypothetical protein